MTHTPEQARKLPARNELERESGRRGETPFPVGGPRDDVYRFLQSRGFIMSNWSDKLWTRADGVELHLHGSGSQATIYGKDRELLTSGRLADAMEMLSARATGQ